MADMIEIKATARAVGGKGAAKATRREGLIPAVIYGDKKSPEPIALTYKDVWKQLQTGLFLSTVYTIELAGQKTRVIPRDVQFDPVRDFPIHVDFLRLGKGATITVNVPVHFLNEETAPGIKRGGVLNIVRHEIELNCSADAIPESIAADIGELDIGDSLHISDIKLPEGANPTITDRDFTIATLAGASTGEAKEPDEEETAEEGEEEEKKEE